MTLISALTNRLYIIFMAYLRHMMKNINAGAYRLDMALFG